MIDVILDSHGYDKAKGSKSQICAQDQDINQGVLEKSKSQQIIGFRKVKLL